MCSGAFSSLFNSISFKTLGSFLLFCDVFIISAGFLSGYPDLNKKLKKCLMIIILLAILLDW
jgi:hypothetical protein